MGHHPPIKFEHCLRPTFTAFLVKKIKQGHSINLIGDHGLGRRRTLDDLQQCLANDMLVLRINLKSYKESYAAFIKELARQLNVQIGQATDLASLLTHMETVTKPIILMLHNFDALLDNPQLDSAFDVAFFDHLNSMRNQKNMGLLCVTVTAHDQSLVMIDGKPHSNSWLDLQQLILPILRQQDLMGEIKRRDLELDADQQIQVIQLSRNHAQAYALLDNISEQIQLCEDVSVQFPEKLKKWKKSFEKQNRLNLMHVHKGVQTAKVVGAVTGLEQLKTPFQTILTLLQKVIGK